MRKSVSRTLTIQSESGIDNQKRIAMPKDIDVFCVTISARFSQAFSFINPSVVATFTLIVKSDRIENDTDGVQSFFTPIVVTDTPTLRLLYTQCPPIKLDRKATDSIMVDELFCAMFTNNLAPVPFFIDVIFEGYLP